MTERSIQVRLMIGIFTYKKIDVKFDKTVVGKSYIAFRKGEKKVLEMDITPGWDDDVSNVVYATIGEKTVEFGNKCNHLKIITAICEYYKSLSNDN